MKSLRLTVAKGLRRRRAEEAIFNQHFRSCPRTSEVPVQQSKRGSETWAHASPSSPHSPSPSPSQSRRAEGIPLSEVDCFSVTSVGQLWHDVTMLMKSTYTFKACDVELLCEALHFHGQLFVFRQPGGTGTGAGEPAGGKLGLSPVAGSSRAHGLSSPTAPKSPQAAAVRRIQAALGGRRRSVVAAEAGGEDDAMMMGGMFDGLVGEEEDIAAFGEEGVDPADRRGSLMSGHRRSSVFEMPTSVLEAGDTLCDFSNCVVLCLSGKATLKVPGFDAFAREAVRGSIAETLWKEDVQRRKSDLPGEGARAPGSAIASAAAVGGRRGSGVPPGSGGGGMFGSALVLPTPSHTAAPAFSLLQSPAREGEAVSPHSCRSLLSPRTRQREETPRERVARMAERRRLLQRSIRLSANVRAGKEQRIPKEEMESKRSAPARTFTDSSLAPTATPLLLLSPTPPPRTSPEPGGTTPHTVPSSRRTLKKRPHSASPPALALDPCASLGSTLRPHTSSPISAEGGRRMPASQSLGSPYLLPSPMISPAVPPSLGSASPREVRLRLSDTRASLDLFGDENDNDSVKASTLLTKEETRGQEVWTELLDDDKDVGSARGGRDTKRERRRETELDESRLDRPEGTSAGLRVRVDREGGSEEDGDEVSSSDYTDSDAPRTPVVLLFSKAVETGCCYELTKPVHVSLTGHHGGVSGEVVFLTLNKDALRDPAVIRAAVERQTVTQKLASSVADLLTGGSASVFLRLSPDLSFADDITGKLPPMSPLTHHPKFPRLLSLMAGVESELHKEFNLEETARLRAKANAPLPHVPPDSVKSLIDSLGGSGPSAQTPREGGAVQRFSHRHHSPRHREHQQQFHMDAPTTSAPTRSSAHAAHESVSLASFLKSGVSSVLSSARAHRRQLARKCAESVCDALDVLQRRRREAVGGDTSGQPKQAEGLAERREREEKRKKTAIRPLVPRVHLRFTVPGAILQIVENERRLRRLRLEELERLGEKGLDGFGLGELSTGSWLGVPSLLAFAEPLDVTVSSQKAVVWSAGISDCLLNWHPHLLQSVIEQYHETESWLLGERLGERVAATENLRGLNVTKSELVNLAKLASAVERSKNSKGGEGYRQNDSEGPRPKAAVAHDIFQKPMIDWRLTVTMSPREREKAIQAPPVSPRSVKNKEHIKAAIRAIQALRTPRPSSAVNQTSNDLSDPLEPPRRELNGVIEEGNLLLSPRRRAEDKPNGPIPRLPLSPEDRHALLNAVKALRESEDRVAIEILGGSQRPYSAGQWLNWASKQARGGQQVGGSAGSRASQRPKRAEQEALYVRSLLLQGSQCMPGCDVKKGFVKGYSKEKELDRRLRSQTVG
uniref:Uncharacterized protein n=1 Tax=Chromera velia CCMP2878 TaxID=1169474 RepID=A0A0G4I0J7_9ALVE|eukprot:Cvel_1634.t1-p1 / transcript=Cvel_1634.t1 / gene=Cvel_1634 / organism=Chromera_velia_CCMP2878 / gene_product=hypothetical protein / transcript_product=hypothetical protein / location=Cvel_scaffold58:104057-114671(-) / protein_length=1353 / sequence_SO=supercontig / SO=protein_coding / is_pseudo=false